MSKKDLALDRYRGGFNCAQSVLTAYVEELGVDSETALKIAS